MILKQVCVWLKYTVCWQFFPHVPIRGLWYIICSILSLMDEQNSCDLFKQQEESSLTRKEGFLKKVFITSYAHGHIHVTTWASPKQFYCTWGAPTFVIQKWALLNRIISLTEWNLWCRKLHQHQLLWSHPANKSERTHQPTAYQTMFSARCGANSNIPGQWTQWNISEVGRSIPSLLWLQ